MPTLNATGAADLFRRAPDRFLDVGEGEVAYRRVGTGPDVLFVHGWPVSGATFRTLLPHMADQVTCHVIDLPGAGSSRFTAETTITFDQHFQTVRRVLDQRKFEAHSRRGRPHRDEVGSLRGTRDGLIGALAKQRKRSRRKQTGPR